MIDERRINNFIKVSEVRLIGADSEQIGIVPIQQAMDKANEEGLDLVEISPNAKPPVCKIMDYGKFRFEEEKRQKEAKKKQKIVHLKEIKFRPKIDNHDFVYKVKNAIKFLQRGDKVKITVRFRGREMAHTDLGFKIIDKVRDTIKEQMNYIEEKIASMDGRNIIMVLAPGKKQGKAAPAKDAGKK